MTPISAWYLSTNNYHSHFFSGCVSLLSSWVKSEKLAAVDVYYARSGSDLDDMDQESFPETRNPRLSIKSISREKFRSLITGQAHHMFSPFLNLQIYELFSRNFLCFVFLQGGSFLLRSKMPI